MYHHLKSSGEVRVAAHMCGFMCYLPPSLLVVRVGVHMCAHACDAHVCACVCWAGRGQSQARTRAGIALHCLCCVLGLRPGLCCALCWVGRSLSQARTRAGGASLCTLERAHGSWSSVRTPLGFRVRAPRGFCVLGFVCGVTLHWSMFCCFHRLSPRLCFGLVLGRVHGL